MLKCAHCNKTFKYESERKRHQESHFPQFNCTVCVKRFSFLSALRRHQKQHDRKGAVQCNKCGGSFRDDTLLKRHTQYAHKGSYSCLECSATFSSEQALRTHSNIHKPESERKYCCTFAGCTKTFNFPHHLKHHKLTHTNTKQHFCNICEKGFIQSHHLKTHLKTHHPDKWFYCTVLYCKKKLTTEHALQKHIATHNNNVDFSCTDTKLDSGISSDSSPATDIHEKNDDTEEDNVKCVTCGKNILRLLYLHHTLSCTAAPKELTKCNDLDLLKDFEAQDSSNSTYPITSGTYVDDASVEINKICNNITTGLNFAANCDDSASNMCAGCKCANSRSSSSRAIGKVSLKSKQLNNFNVSNMPELEYRNDGTIKLKETFDVDIIILNKDPAEEDCKDKTESNDIRYVPYNSCKEVLGNCIVSDDGSVGEGCLCAKMLVDEQVSSQEIEELTPNPQALWA